MVAMLERPPQNGEFTLASEFKCTEFIGVELQFARARRIVSALSAFPPSEVLFEMCPPALSSHRKRKLRQGFRYDRRVAVAFVQVDDASNRSPCRSLNLQFDAPLP